MILDFQKQQHYYGRSSHEVILRLKIAKLSKCSSICPPMSFLCSLQLKHPDLPASHKVFLVCRWLIVLWLVEEEVGRKLLVLVAGKVGLDSLIPVESKSA
jgi:hypothetical protein